MNSGMPASIDVTISHGSCAHKLESTNAGTEELSVNELRNDVNDSLNIGFQKQDGTINPSCSCSTALSTTSKPVSAMKGSREKQRPGSGPPQKLTVKWAPEVYDPVPTSVSHAVTDNKPQKQSKKKSKSKSKQKNGNKSSHGNKQKNKSAGKRGCD